MEQNFPATALESKTCPPHHWKIEFDGKGRDGMGHCTNPGCNAVKDFGKLLRDQPEFYNQRPVKAYKGGRPKKIKSGVE